MCISRSSFFERSIELLVGNTLTDDLLIYQSCQNPKHFIEARSTINIRRLNIMSPLSNLRATLTQIYPPRPSFTAANVPPGSQKGRVFVVTGGNSGIGFELCKILYIAGATIYMLSRTKVCIKRCCANSQYQCSLIAREYRQRQKRP